MNSSTKPQKKTSYRYIKELLFWLHTAVWSVSHTNLCFCQVAQIVKREMESVVKLYVKLKAKVKVGPSWGNLQDLDIWNVTVWYLNQTQCTFPQLLLCRYCVMFLITTVAMMKCSSPTMRSEWTFECIYNLISQGTVSNYIFSLEKNKPQLHVIFSLYKYLT